MIRDNLYQHVRAGMQDSPAVRYGIAAPPGLSIRGFLHHLGPIEHFYGCIQRKIFLVHPEKCSIGPNDVKIPGAESPGGCSNTLSGCWSKSACCALSPVIMWVVRQTNCYI